MNISMNNPHVDEVEEDLHILAGLVDSGMDEDGNVDWVGTRQQWDKYELLTNEE